MNKNTLILLNYLMGSSFNSLLFKRIREELNLAYTVNSDIHFYTDHGYLYIYAGISPDRLFDSKRNKGYINELFRILNYLKDVSSNEYDFDLDLFKKLVLKSSVFILEDANELANYAAT